jgi:uncharacterized SAM-binding protein YcdF (DUF218 family)
VKILLLIGLFVAALFGMGMYLAPNDLRGCKEAPAGESRCRTADAVIAISGGDTDARAQKAIELYQNGWAPKLVFSGAAQDETGPSNAAVMRNTALEAGVPEEDIIIDEYSRTTGENAQETRVLLDKESVSSVILVTSSYHQRRASLEFNRALDDIEVRNHPAPGDRQWSQLWWISPRGWWLVLGELAKIAVFYMQGLR